MPIILVTQDVEVGVSPSEISLGKRTKPYLKNKLKKQKDLEGVAQVVEFKILGSIPSTGKRKKKYPA
jgi:hypothetical protein